MTAPNIARQAKEPDDAERITILVTDDDPTQRMLVRAALEERIDVVEAENGLAAVNALQRQHFDLAVLDLDMPVMDGFGVIERARARLETRHLPIVVVTGRDDVIAIERAFALGATSFLCKPLNWNIFRHQVDFVLKVAQGERELRAAKELAERRASLRSHALAALEREIARVSGTPRKAPGATGPRPGMPPSTGAAVDRLQATLNRAKCAEVIATSAIRPAPGLVQSGELATEAIQKVAEIFGASAASRIQLSADKDRRIRCDRGLAVEALVEVLSNAVKFSPPGGKISLRVMHSPPDRVRFEIADSGPGIAEDLLEAMLEPAPSGPGPLGFGLIIAKAVVEQHGGHFGIMSEPGRGTEVFLGFPASDE